MPNNESSIIRSLIKPTIELDDMVAEDLFEGTSQELGTQVGGKTGRQIQKDLGTGYPFIIINNYVFKIEEIVEFTLDASDFIPTVRLKVNLTNTGVFKSNSFPKDGDIMSVFIRAKNDAFKPIRNDYVITSVDAGKGASEGRGSTIIMDGELFVPRIHDEVVKSYNGTTFDVLQKVCRELGLGFATNETSTDDEQIWICGGDTLYNFINHVSEHSWKDERSFYKCYIDVYYHLNFVNINNQVDGDGKLEAAILDTTMMKDFSSDDDVEKGSQVQTKKLLTDMDSLSGTNMFIRQYTVTNNSSEISKKMGYKSFAQFYDQASQQTWEIFVDPIISDGAAETKILLKGRPYPKGPDGRAAENYWETQNKKYWMGIQYKNVHDKYIYAKLWNERNNAELEKMYVETDVERWNPNIYRGERIPLILISQGDILKRKVDATPGEASIPGSETPVVADQLYSGYYMVSGIKIHYTISASSTNYENPPTETASSMYEVFRLTRREWPAPATG
jgi:hypothetical protein